MRCVLYYEVHVADASYYTCFPSPVFLSFLSFFLTFFLSSFLSFFLSFFIRYLVEAEKLLKAEAARVRVFMHSSSLSKVMKECEAELITHCADRLLEQVNL